MAQRGAVIFTHRAAKFAGVLALATVAWASRAQASEGPDIPLDGVRPASAPGLLRRWPFAIHGPAGTSAEALQTTLDTAFQLFDQLQQRFHLPDLAPDGTRGGGPEFDLYLVSPSSEHPRDAVDTVLDTLEYSALWDRASSFVVIPTTLAATDALERPLAEALARAALWSIDARIPSALHTALATTYAARLLAMPLDRDSVVAYQHDADTAVLAPSASRGAALFTQFIASRFDTDDLRGVTGLAWMPVTHTDPSRDHFDPWPNAYVALERMLRAQHGGLPGALLDFQIARALVGTSADTLGFPGVTLDPDDPSLRPQPWIQRTFASLPAWITPPRPLDETGAAFIEIDVSTAGNQGINLWLHAVPYYEWNIAVVRLASDGTTLGELSRAPVVHGEWNSPVEDLERVARLLVVVQCLGNGHLDPYQLPLYTGWFALHASRIVR